MKKAKKAKKLAKRGPAKKAKKVPAAARRPRAARRRSADEPAVASNAVDERTTAAPTNVELRTAENSFLLDNAFLQHGPDGEQSSRPATGGNRIAQAAMQWTYVVRSRQRWSATPATIKRQADVARDFVSLLGLKDAQLAAIAQAGMVEVAINWTGEESDNWPLRILPWEYLISAATKNLRGDLALTVVRHLRRGAEAPPAAAPMQRVLFVESVPGPLQPLYQAKGQKNVIKSMLPSLAWQELVNPSRDRLQQTIQTFRPDIVHLAGFDTHRARTLLLQAGEDQLAAHLEDEVANRKGSDEIRDGYVLAGGAGLQAVRAEELAELLSGAHRPRLVSLNLENSGARIAPLVVAGGASAAIGFQDSFSDEQAELFFSVLYSRMNAQAELHEAFREAWERLRGEPGPRQGSGLVLWSATSAFAPAPTAIVSRRGRPQVRSRIERAEAPAVDASAAEPGQGDAWVGVEVAAPDDLNYSMLHNKQPLFTRFMIKSLKFKALKDVHVRVSLSTGGAAAVYEKTLTVPSPSFDVNPHIHVPLTSEITRSVHESVHTSLLVEVLWGKHVLFRDTLRVRLTPVDQWRDSNNDRKWLPSFIFPRDLAVARLVDAAQRYVRVLRDNPVAGFDGYQSYDKDDPESLTEIDLQVQALWSAIMHEMRLGYINPPPGYSNELDCQRLRTPTMIARDHSGTCIDLALFFAACLELVDIYPVVFLLEGHAFPGYWRASDFHDEFVQAHPERIQEIVRADSGTSAIAGSQAAPWMMGKSTYREIVQLVNAGKLVPLETVGLTELSSFADAIKSGRENLRVQREFEAMIDVAIAREQQVTPLPILGEQS